ncbi:MAG TPA: homoserine kinase [Arachnia sp.]|nr:homoserine kinase [Arachnia sp.]HMT87457.1 homoserine kinase [Arachnia sp.]
MAMLRVRVPATTANLGSGFDCLGAAFDWYDELTLETRPEPGLEVVVTGEGASQVPRDERHLVVATILRGLEEWGGSRPGMRLTAHNTIPHSRGLGSSASAIVAGLALAWGVARPGIALDRQELLRLSSEMEGHPDNAGAAVYGGAIWAWQHEAGVRLIELDLHPSLSAMVWVPEFECRTDEARAVLPATVSRADAVAQAIAAAALPMALTVRPDLLLDATADLLHQRYRADLMRPSFDLMTRLRALGVPAAISGAGPTVLAVAGESVLTRAEAVDSEGFARRSLGFGDGVSLTCS